MDKLYGLIQDINPKEICNHIENGNLAEWCNAWRIAAKEALQPKTNADRIRAMSDEELADFFFESPEIEFTVCEYCQYFGGHTSDTPCKHDMGRCFISAKNEAFKKWLKQPAEE